MAAYRRVYDSRHLQADCQEPGSAPEPYARRSVIKYGLPFTMVSESRIRGSVWYRYCYRPVATIGLVTK